MVPGGTGKSRDEEPAWLRQVSRARTTTTPLVTALAEQVQPAPLLIDDERSSMTTDTPHRTETRRARRVTDGLEPKNRIIAVSLLVGRHTAGRTGVGRGAAATLLAAALPMTIINYATRQGR